MRIWVYSKTKNDFIFYVCHCCYTLSSRCKIRNQQRMLSFFASFGLSYSAWACRQGALPELGEKNFALAVCLKQCIEYSAEPNGLSALSVLDSTQPRQWVAMVRPTAADDCLSWLMAQAAQLPLLNKGTCLAATLRYWILLSHLTDRMHDTLYRVIVLEALVFACALPKNQCFLNIHTILSDTVPVVRIFDLKIMIISCDLDILRWSRSL